MILYSIENYMCPVSRASKCYGISATKFDDDHDTMRNGTQVCTMPAPAELDNLEPQTVVRIGRPSFG